MFVKSFKEIFKHTRMSKLGKEHTYLRHKTVLVFKCDCCGDEFNRDRANMDPKRVSDNYFHVCSSCDAKRFAQKKGVEKRLIWDMPASSTLPIGRF